VFAEFETNLRRERQLEEIANAKVRGVYRAARRVLILPKIKRIKTGGMGPPEREKFRFGTHYFRSGMPWGEGKNRWHKHAYFKMGALTVFTARKKVIRWQGDRHLCADLSNCRTGRAGRACRAVERRGIDACRYGRAPYGKLSAVDPPSHFQHYRVSLAFRGTCENVRRNFSFCP